MPANITGKGQVEVQFNWIFVLIVGVIILAFFVAMAMSQKKASEQSLSTTVMNRMETSLNGIQQGGDNRLILDLPSDEFHIDCTSGCQCGAFSESAISKVKNLNELSDKSIFSPSLIKGSGSYAVVWSKEWEYPFKATTLIYMTSPEIKYYVEDTELGKSIFDSLPPDVMQQNQVDKNAMDKSLFNASDSITLTGAKGAYRVRFVFTDTDPTGLKTPVELQSLSDSSVTAVKINYSSGVPDVVTYYTRSGDSFINKGSSKLLGDATVYAAIFAENKNNYACMMNRAAKFLGVVATIYAEKQAIYNETFKNDANCNVWYDNTNTMLLENYALALDFNNVFTNPTNELNFNNTIKKATSISNQNKESMQKSCPTIY